MNYFSSTIELYREYCRYNNSVKPDGYNSDLAAEGIERIEQLEFILNKIKQTEISIELNDKRSEIAFWDWINDAKTNNIDIAETPAPTHIHLTHEEFKINSVLVLELEILTESFYYFAFRLRNIIRSLPGLKSFEIPKIRNVRNKLIEHPDTNNDSKILTRSNGWGNKKNGPVKKFIRENHQIGIFPDEGLYINAQELKENLDQKLINFLLNTKTMFNKR